MNITNEGKMIWVPGWVTFMVILGIPAIFGSALCWIVSWKQGLFRGERGSIKFPKR